jgi:hypothetical protein
VVDADKRLYGVDLNDESASKVVKFFELTPNDSYHSYLIPKPM